MRMLSWLTYRRARIERVDLEAEALIHDFGSAAYDEARRREHEASSNAIAKDWSLVAHAVAEKTGKPIGLGTSTRMDREKNTPEQIAELNRVLDAKPPQFRVRYIGSGSLRVRSILKEVEIEASDVSAVVIAAANLEWPPKTIALRILDREGREVFGRQRTDH